MQKRILVINANPDSDPARLTAALAHAYRDGAEGAGHTVHMLSLGALSFPLLRSAREFMTAPTEPDIVAARAEFLWAEHIVFIFPLWLGSVPALLKGFMEQVSRAQFALKENPRGFPIGQLAGRSAHVVATMGMPAIFYRVLFGAHGVSAFARSILGFSGMRPVRRTYLGGAASQDSARRWLEQMRKAGQAAR